MEQEEEEEQGDLTGMPRGLFVCLFVCFGKVRFSRLDLLHQN